MVRRSDEVDLNPFAPNAIKEQSTRRFSTDQERANVAPELAQLRQEGYVILPRLIDQSKVQEVAVEFERLQADTPMGDSEFGGYSTQRIYNLVARTRVLDDLILHPRVLALIEAHLEDQIQLSIASSVNLLEGETAQAFHRDDGYYPLPRPHAPLSMNTMWAVDDFTTENGATLLLPGTHLISDPEPPADVRPVSAEMPAGSVMLWDGSLFHAGGTNHTDVARLGVTVIYCRAWLRQQENQFVGIPPSLVKTLPSKLQKLVGYWVVNNLLGYIDNGSPRAYIDQAYPE